jgi:hypothetical protein
MTAIVTGIGDVQVILPTRQSWNNPNKIDATWVPSRSPHALLSAPMTRQTSLIAKFSNLIQFALVARIVTAPSYRNVDFPPAVSR